MAEDPASQLNALMHTIGHISNRDDFLAKMLALPAPLGVGDEVRFDHSTRTWHIWNGIRWEPDKTTSIYEIVRRKVLTVWLNLKVSEDEQKAFLTMLNAQKKDSVLKMLASMPGIAMTGEEWDTNPRLIGFENGVLDLETLNFDTKPDPGLLISRSTRHVWDPSADRTLFDNFLMDIMSGDQDLAFYVLRLLGYSMLGENTEQKFWMWVGGGSNGKGILARTVTKALGDYAYSPPDTLYMRTKIGAATSSTPRPELLKLQGARFTYMSEPQGGQFNEALLKAHSGNDPIEARTLYSAKYKTFFPTHKIIFLTNEMPATDDVGPSMQRRVRIVKFMEDYRPETGRADFTLEPRLQEEKNLQGALVAMAHAAQLYIQSINLPEPEKVLGWSKAYINDNDPTSAFVSAMCIEDKEAEQQAGALYKAFDTFCEQNGYEGMTMTAFGRHMAGRYVKKVRATGTFYTGLRLKNMTDHVLEGKDGDE